MPTATAIAYTRPMSTNNDHNARHDRLEDAILSMAETQRRQDETLRELKAAALKHDVMLEMLQAIQRDQTRDIQEHKETQNRIVVLLEQQNSMMLKVIDTQLDHAASIRRHEETQREQKETQEAMRVAIQTLSTILRRLTENGNSAP